MYALDLSGKVVAITGAFGSLGSAAARAVSSAGAKIAMVDQVVTSQAPAGLPEGLQLGGIDLGSAESAQATFSDIAKRLGRLDALVNVAGTFRWEKIETGSVDTWDLLYTVNLRTAVNASRSALPHLLKQPASRIVNIGAGAAAKAGTGMGAYAASKSGVARLTEALSDEFKDRGLTANAVLPSIIDTPPNRTDMPDADFSRWVKAEEIADLIVFLLSDRARAITGASIPISGRV
jgi:NAD(P)-dependent dehydrogenase (short-subunit alcohol dehydrogenase family)